MRLVRLWRVALFIGFLRRAVFGVMNPASRSSIRPEDNRTGARIVEAHDLAVFVKPGGLREGKASLDARDHGLINQGSLAEVALLLRALARGEVTQTRLAPKDLTLRGHFEPLGRRLLRLMTCCWLWHGGRTVAVVFSPARAI